MQPPSSSPKGFFASLLDFGFSSLITTRIIKVVYIIITVVVSLAALGFLIAELSRGGADIVLGVVLAPIGWLLYMIGARITLEIVIIVFRIGEDVRRIADAPRAGSGSGATPPGGFPPPGRFPGPGGFTPQGGGWPPPTP
jgi:hypothetical protein